MAARPDPPAKAAAAKPAAVIPQVPPPPPIQYKGTPFYSQITPVPYAFKKAVNLAGTKVDASMDVPLVTLPPGTLLFRGIRVPKVEEGEDSRRFFTEFLGNPEGTSMCLTPYHNTFFYPMPYIAFGAHDIGKTFNAVQIYCTTRPLNVMSGVSPSPWFRSITKGDEYQAAEAPLQRCDNFSEWCHELSFRERDALRYDNCINPIYAQKTGVRGWMALADLDSLKPYKLREGKAKNSPMGEYLLKLGQRNPGLTEEMLTHLYVDSRKHTGYPEIALYPLKTHQGSTLIKRPAATEREVQIALQKLARQNELNFLPLATITEEGIADMVNGMYTLHAVPGVPDYDGTVYRQKEVRPMIVLQDAKHPAIERHLAAWLESMKTNGTTLPHYGEGVLSFDMRTGFYVLPQMVPKDLRVRGETPADAPTYNSLLIRLNTPELRQRATDYAVMFRTFLPHLYMKKYPLAKGFGVPRAMIFSRPGSFKRWFEELEIPAIPPALDALGKRASFQFEMNTGRHAAKKAAANAAAASVPLYAPANTVAPASPKTPPFAEAAAAPAAPRAQAAKAVPVNLSGVRGNLGVGLDSVSNSDSNSRGGSRGRGRGRGRRGGGTQKRSMKNSKKRKTRCRSKVFHQSNPHNLLQSYATVYKSVWNALAKI